MRVLVTKLFFLLLLLTNLHSFAEPENWREYSIAEHGFVIAMPSKPQRRVLPVPSGGGYLRVYEAFEPQRKLSRFSVFVGQPEQRGVFDAASMDAFLSAHITALVLVADKGKLESSRRITFRGQPALEYRFSHQMEDQPYVGRGVTFMIDGGHMRVSMWYPAGDKKAEAEYQHFIASFQLRPIAFRPASASFKDDRGITFSPPEGWVQKPVHNALEAAWYSNLTRSLQLLVAGNAAYTCASFRAEMQSSGRLKEAVPLELGDQSFVKLTSFEDVPKYNVRLTTEQYCLNSRLGAVVLGGSEEEIVFWRWAQVFEGAARSLRIR
jgi:hypothetical protein